MDIKEFAADFMANVENYAEVENKDKNEELTESILEYIEDSGDVGAPTICSFKKRMVSLNAYDYNYEGDSLDLFVLVKADVLLGKINNSKIDEAFSRLYHFYDEVRKDKLLNSVESPHDELKEISDLIKSSIGHISTLRLYVLTNGMCEYNPSTYVNDEYGFIVEQNVWDIQRVYQQDRIKRGEELVEIDFPTIYDTKLQCLKMNNCTSGVESYLAVIPGIILARIYKKYQHALLERNVRTFLQFKPRVNKEIRKTLQEEPDMFFSYNNGISSTASGIETIRKEGSLYITRLTNWQIVNGGQTTGTIASTYNEKGTDLSKVYVPMKISVITNDEDAKTLVDKISKYANSQTGIKKSDFSANDPYLVELEKISRLEWVPNGNSKPISKWYFERTRGQYLDELAQLNGINEKLFRTEYPKNQKIVKTDIAVYEECWNLHPSVVCRGPEEVYKQFVKEIQSEKIQVTPTYYKRIIAKAILYKAIDHKVKMEQLGGYKANLNAYIMSSLSFLSQKTLDLDYIWTHQSVQQELMQFISELIPIIWSHLTNFDLNSQAINPALWSRNEDCWESLKLKLDSFKPVPDELRASPFSMIDETLTQARRTKIEEAWGISSKTWFELTKWAKENNYFTPMERKFLYGLGAFRGSNRMFSFKQANEGMSLYYKAIQLGFVIDEHNGNK